MRTYRGFQWWDKGRPSLTSETDCVICEIFYYGMKVERLIFERRLDQKASQRIETAVKVRIDEMAEDEYRKDEER